MRWIFLALLFCVTGLPLITGNLFHWVNRDLHAVENNLTNAKRALTALGEPIVGQTVPELGYMHSLKTSDLGNARWVQVDLKKALRIDQIALVPAQTDWHLIGREVFRFPKRFKVEVSEEPDFHSPLPVFDSMSADYPEPGMAPVTLRTDQTGRYVRVTVISPEVFTLAELMVLVGNRNVAIGCDVLATGSVDTPPRWNRKSLVDGYSPLGPPILEELIEYDGVFAGPTEDSSPVWMQIDLKDFYEIDEVRLHPVHSRFDNDLPGYGFPKRFRIDLSQNPDFNPQSTMFDAAGNDFQNPGNNALTAPVNGFPIGYKARYVRVALVEGGAYSHPGRFGLSEIQVYSGNKNIAPFGEVTSTPDTSPKKDWPRAVLTDGYTSYGRLIELPEWLENWTQRRRLQRSIQDLEARQAILSADSKRRIQWAATGLIGIFFAGVALVAWNGRRMRNKELRNFRRKLAQDLHDEVGSNLAALGMISQAAAKSRAVDPTENWIKVNQIARETTDAMRETLWASGGNEEMGIELIQHFQKAAARMLPDRNVQWSEMSADCDLPDEWPVPARKEVFLFFKEALANVARHSQADSVKLSTTIEAGVFILKIDDNGQGFVTETKSRGIGLYSLKERALRIGGDLKINAAPGCGTQIVLRVKMP